MVWTLRHSEGFDLLRIVDGVDNGVGSTERDFLDFQQSIPSSVDVMVE